MCVYARVSVYLPSRRSRNRATSVFTLRPRAKYARRTRPSRDSRAAFFPPWGTPQRTEIVYVTDSIQGGIRGVRNSLNSHPIGSDRFARARAPVPVTYRDTKFNCETCNVLRVLIGLFMADCREQAGENYRFAIDLPSCDRKWESCNFEGLFVKVEAQRRDAWLMDSFNWKFSHKRRVSV